jgi:two-component system, NarL family, response regulator
MTNTDPIRILIVDDHFVVRMGLITMIDGASDMTVVADAENGADAIKLFQTHQPDITIVDLRMPGMNGIELISTLRKEYPQASFIVLSTYDGDADIQRAIKAGAKSYVLKDSLGEQLLAAIRAVHQGKKFIPRKVADRLYQYSGSELSKRELEVLQLIAKGLNNKEIGDRLQITGNTVKSYIKNIMAKLQVDDRTQAAITALQRGIISWE